MTTATALNWAVEEFGSARVNDARWRSRLIAMGAQAACNPGGKVSMVFNNAAARQGAYGLLESTDVTPSQVAETIFGAAARRCSSLPFVYVPVDGSSLTLTDRRQTKDFGQIGTHICRARGIEVISSLFVSPDGVPLGLGAQIWWTREKKQKKKHHSKRRTEEKETQHWLEAMQQTRDAAAANDQKTRLWFQLDREGDAWPIITSADQDDHWFTIRANHNRRVTLPNGKITYLRAVLGEQLVVHEYFLHVSGNHGRISRTARMVMRACEVTIDFKDKLTKKHFSKSLNVVMTVEDGTTPPGEKPIEWILLTNHPIAAVEDLNQVVHGYSMRWRIEDFHRTWKSGACCVEDTQLHTSNAVKKWATILATVAVRIERLKVLSRKEPKRPASDEFTPIELRAIALIRFGEKAGKEIPKGTVPTIKQAVQWVAEIGGYTGKSSGGPPGSVTIGRGLREVLLVTRVLTALQSTCD